MEEKKTGFFDMVEDTEEKVRLGFDKHALLVRGVVETNLIMLGKYKGYNFAHMYYNGKKIKFLNTKFSREKLLKAVGYESKEDNITIDSELLNQLGYKSILAEVVICIEGVYDPSRASKRSPDKFELVAIVLSDEWLLTKI